MTYAQTVALRRELDEEKPSSQKRKARSVIKEPLGKRHTTSSTSKLIGRTEPSLDTSSVAFTSQDALETLYVPPLPLRVGSPVTVDRNDEIPQPGHRVSIKRKWYTLHLGWLDGHGGTIKSISEGENGGMILHIVCDLVKMDELDVPYPHDQVTSISNNPNLAPSTIGKIGSRLLSSYLN